MSYNADDTSFDHLPLLIFRLQGNLLGVVVPWHVMGKRILHNWSMSLTI
jgi:hypothetical protein